MFVTSAVGLGFLAVFLAGAGVTWAVLEQIAKRGKRNPVSYWNAPDVVEPPCLTEKDIESISLVGGGLSVALVIGSFFVMPREWFAVVWGALSVLGILCGLFTFIINEPAPKTQRRDEKAPPSSARVPPRGRQDDQKPPASASQSSTAQQSAYRSEATTHATPPMKMDFYRELLAKARYDKRLADRLIEYERTRFPHASWDDLCKNAVDRWERSSR
jgi:hypothetical protein